MIKQLSGVFMPGRKGNRTGPSLDSGLARFDGELSNLAQLVMPAETASPRTPFDSNVPFAETSFGKYSWAEKRRLLPTMMKLQLEMRKSSKLYDGTFEPKSSSASAEFIAELEALAVSLGASAVRYVKVPPNAIFRDKGIPHEYAIVFTVEMNEEPFKTTPSFEAQLEVVKGYKNLAVISNKVARHIHASGFATYPGTAVGGLTDYPYLAELAGLGAIGYHGLLISPESGPRLRITTIYTNIDNLPIQSDNEHLWIRDFCAMCKKCIRSCPVDAIFEEPRMRGDGARQCIDHDLCRDYFHREYGCAVCLAKCPFSDAGYEKVKSRFKGNPNAPYIRLPIELT